MVHHYLKWHRPLMFHVHFFSNPRMVKLYVEALMITLHLMLLYKKHCVSYDSKKSTNRAY